MSPSVPRFRAGPWLRSAPIFAVAAVAVYYYPLGAIWLGLGLVAYAALLWRYPRMWLPVVLALLPLLNFAPWTGWILIDEFDLLIAVTLAMRMLQQSSESGGPHLTQSAKWAIGMLTGSFIASAVVGAVPLSPFDQNALFGYYSNFNSLRVLKGIAWALALLPMLVEEMKFGPSADQRFVVGMLAGLSGVVAVAVWQRAVFTGLLDFAKDFRITATFPEMHTGGGYVETYLAAAIPFTLAWIMLKPGLPRLLLGGVLFASATYALVVTFARAGYLGYAIGLLTFGGAAFSYWRRNRAWKLRHVAAAAGVLVVGAAVVMPVLTGTYMQSRLASVRGDATTRTQHWTDIVGMMNDDWKSRLIGMGLGSFPRTYLLRNPHGVVPATFSYMREGDNVFLRLGSGDALYLGQHIDVVANRTYALNADVRSANPDARLRVYLCEKAELYSFRCKSLEFAVNANGKWERHEAMVDSGEVGQGSWPLRRPVVLSLYNPQGGVVDVDNVRLIDQDHGDLIANGDFSSGGNRWSFSTDDHLPWHIKHLWVQILFEQGWIGIATVGFALFLAMARLTARAWRGDLFAGTLLASMSAFMVLGFFDSTFDATRLTTLFFIVLFTALCRAR